MSRLMVFSCPFVPFVVKEVSSHRQRRGRPVRVVDDGQGVRSSDHAVLLRKLAPAARSTHLASPVLPSGVARETSLDVGKSPHSCEQGRFGLVNETDGTSACVVRNNPKSVNAHGLNRTFLLLTAGHVLNKFGHAQTKDVATLDPPITARSDMSRAALRFTRVNRRRTAPFERSDHHNVHVSRGGLRRLAAR